MSNPALHPGSAVGIEDGVLPSPESLADIRSALARRDKIAAIKLVRQATGWDLKAAKEAAERLAAGTHEKEVFSGTPPPAQGSGVPPFPEVETALIAGNKIEAIRIYRQRTGCGLAEARHAVEQIAAKRPGVLAPVAPGLPTPTPNLPTNAAQKTGCLGLLVLISFGASAAVAWLCA